MKRELNRRQVSHDHNKAKNFMPELKFIHPHYEKQSHVLP